MKKGILFFLVASLFITTGLRFVRNSSIGNNGALVQKQTEEITLNQFLSGYNNGLYEKVELKDAVLLQ